MLLFAGCWISGDLNNRWPGGLKALNNTISQLSIVLVQNMEMLMVFPGDHACKMHCDRLEYFEHSNNHVDLSVIKSTADKGQPPQVAI